ncbi:hypothetical protein HELRODRAFT_190575 [Helobdella robusta]|uniref:VWFA domain-containing protein n=1 Tax=Helobdella robusta TaxID=6412 RepID=T1FS40_HELRO|nr:hypothetical protein HELRODRAFT_190575 [Helobdella robusta]ESO09608.1 hypothetical protein HELRODRAFT_190575 [Helobdella robusta]
MKFIATLPKAFIINTIIFFFFASWTSTVSARRFKRQNIDVTTSVDTPDSSETSTLPTTTTTTITTSTTTTPTTTTSTTTTTTTRSSSTNSSINSIIGDLGPLKEVDVVLVMSRARSIGKRVFYEHGRPVAFRLLRQYATVHPSFTRVAFITYAFNSTVVYNGITDRSKAMDKCAMFPPVPDSNG